jgi:hypothetical protein
LFGDRVGPASSLLVAISLLATGAAPYDGSTPRRTDMARPSLRDLFRNFDDYDAPLDRKIRKALRNNARKVVTLSECCGHPGEPGC